jgi:hypothetical protein
MTNSILKKEKHQKHTHHVMLTKETNKNEDRIEQERRMRELFWILELGFFRE